MEIAERILQGDRLALARLLTWLENDQPRGRAALDALFPHTGKAHIIGVTGPFRVGQIQPGQPLGAAADASGKRPARAARGRSGSRPQQPVQRRILAG